MKFPFRIALSDRYALIVILAVASVLRFSTIGRYALAGDEKYSLFVSQFICYEGNNQKDSVRKPGNDAFTPAEFWSKKGIPDFIEAIARLDNGNGALYTFVLHYWIQLTGIDDGSIRTLSAVFNLLTLVLLFYFVKTHFKSRSLAYLVMILGALSPFFIAYSQINRTYSMLYFFTLLSTHFFLKGIDRLSEKKRPVSLLVLYGLTVAACLFCHVSVFPIFFVHGLYLLLFYRRFSYIIPFAAAMLIPVALMGTWLLSDGGKGMSEFVKNSTRVYNEMAAAEPTSFLSLTSPKTVLLQIRHVISLMFISSEGLYQTASGFKNVILSVFLSLASIAILMINRLDKRQKTGLIALLSVVVLALISVNRLPFFVLSVNLTLPVIFVLYLTQESDQLVRRKYILLALISVASLLFLIVFAIMDGNTFRILARYSGYAYSFNLVLVAVVLRFVFTTRPVYSPFILTAAVLQLFFLGGIVQRIFQDNPPKYFMLFGEPRIKNPYPSIANQIEDQYRPGDMVIYPSNSSFLSDEGQTIPSVIDAQLVNMYLPKDAAYVQRVDFTEKNKVILKKAGGKDVVLFDFEGDRFRY